MTGLTVSLLVPPHPRSSFSLSVVTSAPGQLSSVVITKVESLTLTLDCTDACGTHSNNTLGFKTPQRSCIVQQAQVRFIVSNPTLLSSGFATVADSRSKV